MEKEPSTKKIRARLREIEKEINQLDAQLWNNGDRVRFVVERASKLEVTHHPEGVGFSFTLGA